ncbi:MAG: redoxin domain-containing protein, partial [Rubripirellula sp.]
HAESDVSVFSNARNMSPEDKETLRDWVEAGMPYGNAKDQPPAQSYVDGWRLPEKPDLVVKLYDQELSAEQAFTFPECFHIPAHGEVDYQYFVVDPQFTEDTWIRAAQVRPGNTAVVHHCIVFTRPPDGTDFRNIGFLAAYVPGQSQGALPEGYAQKVPAGSLLVFQMHYTPTGKPETDNTSLGLLFADRKEVTHEVAVYGGINHEFEIEPGALKTVEGTVDGYPRNGLLLSVTPHMHLRGKSYSFELQYDDRSAQLLNVPAYDFNWQHNYELAAPLPLRNVRQMKFKATFDNSADNPFNPNPNDYVFWGDQTWQEMAVTFVTVAEPLSKSQGKGATADQLGDSKAKVEGNARRREAAKQREAEIDDKATQYADKYMERLDSNQDGYVSEREMPNAVRVRGHWSLDSNQDWQLSHDEIKAEAVWRFRRKTAK